MHVQCTVYTENATLDLRAPKRIVVRRATPVFFGALDRDFPAATFLKYQKDAATAGRSVAARDDRHFYVAWEVKDGTPWVNGADAPEFLYARGDTVDLQLGLRPYAPKDRRSALGRLPAAGDILWVDFGATHGDRSGMDTAQGTYWSNQNTGWVSDEAYELAMTPAAWGEIELER
jgi:hypothetical protein